MGWIFTFIAYAIEQPAHQVFYGFFRSRLLILLHTHIIHKENTIYNAITMTVQQLVLPDCQLHTPKSTTPIQTLAVASECAQFKLGNAVGTVIVIETPPCNLQIVLPLPSEHHTKAMSLLHSTRAGTFEEYAISLW